MKINLFGKLFSLPVKMEEEVPLLYKRYNLIYIMIAFFHPLWGIILNLLMPQFHDPLIYRLFCAALAMSSLYISTKFNFTYGKRYLLVMLNLFILNFYLLWVTAGTENNTLYIIGSYLTFIGTGMLFDDEKTLVFFIVSMILPLVIFNGSVINSYFPVNFIYLMFFSGAVFNYLGLKDRFQLITKLRYLNDEIKQKSKELDRERINTFNASKLASLGEMAGGIAHEMNNPLTIIQGFARKLKRNFSDIKEGENTEESLRSLEKIIETTNRMALIIKKFKKFSRDGTNDELSFIKPAALIESIIHFFDERFKIDLIKCYIEVNPSELKNVAIFCREVEISQVLINLFNNAIYAAKENTIREAEVMIGCFCDSDYVYFTVEDSGAGVPKEIEAKIFEPFFTTKQDIRATGLGLSISKTVVEEYQGSIYLDHTVNSTKFVVKLKKAAVEEVS